jgi:CRISPR-associated endonuclease Cas3-HD
MDADLRNRYRSHPDKLLHVHTRGVVEGVERRTSSKIAAVAAIFHDLGKLNPNFQPKLDGIKVSGYSNHAYLSALAWLCFMRENAELVKELIGGNPAHVYSVAAIVARHHGHLPDMEKGFFKPEEGERLKEFLRNLTEEMLPISDYLGHVLPDKPYKPFTVSQSQERLDIFISQLPLNFRTCEIISPIRSTSFWRRNSLLLH